MRRLLATSLLLFGVYATWAQDAKDDTPAAAATRKLLQNKISVDYEDTLLQQVAEDLATQVQGLKTKIDTNSGASVNSKITFKSKNKTLAETLDEMGKKYDLGYIVISKEYKTFKKFDGYLLIVKGSERGFPSKGK